MIPPTNGRVVWYRPSEHDKRVLIVISEQPITALIVYVWDDRTVNLAVFDHNGISHPRVRVPLLQEGDCIPPRVAYAEWMPYQLEQAKRTESLEELQRPAEAAAGKA